MNLREYLILACAIALFVMAGGRAAAHSFPVEERPAAGADLTTAPQQIAIKFDAPIEQLFAKIDVTGPGGNSVSVGTPQVSSDGYTLSANLPPLGPGDYQVKWEVVCIDTHHTGGSYEFTVTGKKS
jgi:methionine-rich copper-binding protein CopC